MSANSPLVNAHINRVANENSGDFSTIDQSWLQTVYAWLVSEGIASSLLHWADPAFGVTKSGSNITRVYDLGSTYLPRTLDLTAYDSTKTTYNATGLNSLIPAFVNSDGASYLYWGRNNRFTQIRWKQQLTIAALYARTQSTSDICFAGIPTSSTTPNWVTNPSGYNIDMTPKYTGSLIPGISLVHTSGTPGSIQFKLSDRTATSQTASVTASGATTQIAIGTYDGTTMKAYSDASGGTGNTSLISDPLFAGDQALAGCRRGASLNAPLLTVGDTVAVSAFASPNDAPFTTLGQVMSIPNKAFALGARTFTNSYAQFKASCIIILGVGLDATKASSLYNLLKTRAGI